MRLRAFLSLALATVLLAGPLGCGKDEPKVEKGGDLNLQSRPTPPKPDAAKKKGGDSNTGPVAQ